MSRPRYTRQQVADALARAKGMISVAARSLNCEPQTVRNYVARYPDVAAAIHEAREATLDVSELALYKAIEDGEGWAVKYILSTQGKYRGYVEGQPVDVRAEAERLARENGLDVEEVIREAERIVRPH